MHRGQNSNTVFTTLAMRLSVKNNDALLFEPSQRQLTTTTHGILLSGNLAKPKIGNKPCEASTSRPSDRSIN